MESNEQTLRSYKNLILKNKATIASLQKMISNERQVLIPAPSQALQEMRQKYDIALAASKASIDQNILLQTELQIKQKRLKSLRERFYQNFEEMQGLEFEMRRAGQLKKQTKIRQQSSRVKISNQRLKKEVQKLNKKKSKLQKQEGELAMKEKVKRQNIAKIQHEIQESQKRFAQEEKAQSLKIQKIQHEIIRQQSIILSIKNNGKSSTPQKIKQGNPFHQMIMRIRHERKSLQD